MFITHCCVTINVVVYCLPSTTVYFIATNRCSMLILTHSYIDTFTHVPFLQCLSIFIWIFSQLFEVYNFIFSPSKLANNRKTKRDVERKSTNMTTLWQIKKREKKRRKKNQIWPISLKVLHRNHRFTFLHEYEDTRSSFNTCFSLIGLDNVEQYTQHRFVRVR